MSPKGKMKQVPGLTPEEPHRSDECCQTLQWWIQSSDKQEANLFKCCARYPKTLQQNKILECRSENRPPQSKRITNTLRSEKCFTCRVKAKRYFGVFFALEQVWCGFDVFVLFSSSTVGSYCPPSCCSSGSASCTWGESCSRSLCDFILFYV